MKMLSRENLKRLIKDIQGDMSSFSSSAVCTFEEVYNNIDALEARIGGITYSSDTETVTIPTSIGSYDNETIILK